MRLKILLDHCVPRPLRKHFPDPDTHTVFERGWSTLENGDLLEAAEAEGFSVLITTDQNIRYQQNLEGRNISMLILVAGSNRLKDLLPLVPSPSPLSANSSLAKWSRWTCQRRPELREMCALVIVNSSENHSIERSLT